MNAIRFAFPALLALGLSDGLFAQDTKQPVRSQYLNPLNIRLFPIGSSDIARVLLAGSREEAEIDIKKGHVRRWPLREREWFQQVWEEEASYVYAFSQFGFDYRPRAEIGATLKAVRAAGVVHPPMFWLGPTPFTGQMHWIMMPRMDVLRPPYVYGLGLYHYARTQVSTPQGQLFVSTIKYLPPVAFSQGSNDRLVVLDEPRRGYADPSDFVVDRSRERVFVTIAGADLVLVLDARELMQQLKNSGQPKVPPSFDLTQSHRLVIAKIPTQANPRRMALSRDHKTVVVTNYLSDSLTVIDAENLKVIKHISLGGAEPDAARRGEILFNSSRMTFQGRFTCASCHPDGGADGLNWDLPGDGVGNPMNTRSLKGVKDTAPYGWHGSSQTLTDRVVGTLQTLHRHEPQGTEVADLVAYLETLEAQKPAPPTKDEQQLERGRALFHGKAKCAGCHRPGLFSDGLTHDVGTRTPRDSQDKFDTPSLRGVVHTAPYLHHGKASTLEEIFTRYNPRSRHGAAHLLDSKEIRDLAWFLKSL